MLQASEWRGKDATGLAFVRLGSLDKPANVFKKAMRASDFICLEQYSRIMRDMDTFGYLLGHARASTTDKWNYTDYNAHPFQYDAVTLTHNGHITNTLQLNSGHTHAVDSAHVAGALSRVTPKEAPEVLGALQGGFALAWHDARDGSLNFARNHARPLFWFYVEKENTMFWGSELETMYAIAIRNGIDIEGKFKFCTQSKQFKFEAGNLRSYKQFPFVYRPSQNHHTTGTSGAPWRTGMRRLNDTGGQTKNGSNGGTSSSVIGSTNDEPRPSRGSLRPTKSRKIRAIKERLLKLGFKLDAVACFVPEEFRGYVNQKGNYGAISGHDRTRNQLFEIGNISRVIWQRCQTHGKIYGRIVNLRRDPKRKKDDGYIIICDYDKDNQDRFVFNKAAAGPEVPAKHLFRTGQEPSANDVESTASTELYRGPGSRLVDSETWHKHTKDGCAFCTSDVPLLDHEEILWVSNGTRPLCRACSVDPRVLEDLGIPQDKGNIRIH